MIITVYNRDVRVLEPDYFKNIQKSKNSRKFINKRSFGLIIILLAVSGYISFGQNLLSTRENIKQKNLSDNSSSQIEIAPSNTILRQFTNIEFKDLYRSYAYPNTTPIKSAPYILSNQEVDDRIREIAKKRGYLLGVLPVAFLNKINISSEAEEILLQPNAALAWKNLQEEAAKAGLKLDITSGYRSIDEQRSMFSRELANKGANVHTILEGYADDEIEEVLKTIAPPGFSRHHSGFAIDLSCNGIGHRSFIRTNCYTWLSQENFKHAKEHGWIPSYPEGITDNGPEPEPWEFIWVGKDVLTVDQ